MGFDRAIRLEFHGARVSSDAGLLAYAELDDALGLTAMAEGVLGDCRTGMNTQHGLAALLRQAIYSRPPHIDRIAERGFDEMFGFLGGGHIYWPEKLTVADPRKHGISTGPSCCGTGSGWMRVSI